MTNFVPLVKGVFLDHLPEDPLPTHILLDGSSESAHRLYDIYKDYDFTTPIVVQRGPCFSATVTLDGKTSDPVFFSDLTGFHRWKVEHLYCPKISLSAESVRQEHPTPVEMTPEDITAFTYLCREIYGIYLEISDSLGIPPLLIDSMTRATYYLDKMDKPGSLEELRSITGIPGISYNKVMSTLEVEITRTEKLEETDVLSGIPSHTICDVLAIDGTPILGYDSEKDELYYYDKFDGSKTRYVVEKTCLNDLIRKMGRDDVIYDEEINRLIVSIDYYAFLPALLNQILGEVVLPKLAKIKYRTIQFRLNGAPITVGGVAVSTFILERDMQFVEYSTDNTPTEDDLRQMAAKIVINPLSPYQAVLTSAAEVKNFFGATWRQSLATDYALYESLTSVP